MFKLGIITASDKCSKGERLDESGAMIKNIMIKEPFEVIKYVVLPDEKEGIMQELVHMSDALGADLILTTGGTGFSKRDVTPEATLQVITKNAPGICEAMRYYSLGITPRAMLSRAVSGIRNDTLIVNLPGSPKALKESLEYIVPALIHGLEILKGTATECARDKK